MLIHEDTKLISEIAPRADALFASLLRASFHRAPYQAAVACSTISCTEITPFQLFFDNR